MRDYHLYRYRIPMDSQVILRNRFLKEREGLLVHIKCKDNEGWGEIAPLPEFSQETVEMAQKQTALWLKKWDEARSQNQKLSLDGLYPSVAFGLSCALAELKNTLAEQGNFRSAPLCYGDPDELFDKLNQMQGEKVAKVKVGMYEANRDGMIVDMLLEAVPDLQLRLDANRSWSSEKAAMFAKYVKPAHRRRIQFLEEPCKTPELSRQFALETDIAIAWDETTREPDFQLKNQPHFNPYVTSNLAAIVIKPTLVGSLQKCIDLIQQAHQLGIKAVISSSLESSFGLTQLARIAHQYTPNTIPGLDTLDLMAYQIIRPWQHSDLPLIDLNSEFITPIDID
ncbi:MAG: o-succinylbenzoate synthase [Lonepinella koalarum]|nr:o-succinylbenzoate synthase [Lonepinella koalarum]